MAVVKGEEQSREETMNTLRVLVVDDEPGMRSGLIRSLQRYTFSVAEVDGEIGFELEEAETAEDAFERLQVNPPDIMLLDYKLPGMSGLDLLEKLNGQSRDILTIMVTAYASIETAVVATKRGAYDFLVKPFTPAELKQVISKAAGHVMITRHARQLAEERRRVRFEFIRVLGHELKAPLNAVEGYLNIMQAEGLGPLPEGYGQMVDRSIVRLQGMRKLIADLLDMTRIESGEKQRQLSEVDLADVARNVRETMLPEAEKRGIDILLDIDEPMVMRAADRGEMEMLLNNLVSNAVKYNRDGGSVTVRIAKDGDVVTVAVTDTGIGMSAEEVSKLFGEFVRIKNRKTHGILGSGLGLSILKKIAGLYGGVPKVESQPDVGSTFTVTLHDREPVAAEAETAPA